MPPSEKLNEYRCFPKTPGDEFPVLPPAVGARRRETQVAVCSVLEKNVVIEIDPKRSLLMQLDQIVEFTFVSCNIIEHSAHGELEVYPQEFLYTPTSSLRHGLFCSQMQESAFRGDRFVLEFCFGNGEEPLRKTVVLKAKASNFRDLW